MNVSIPNGHGSHGHDQPDSIGLGCGHASHMVVHSGRGFDAWTPTLNLMCKTCRPVLCKASICEYRMCKLWRHMIKEYDKVWNIFESVCLVMFCSSNSTGAMMCLAHFGRWNPFSVWWLGSMLRRDHGNDSQGVIAA